MSLKNQSMAVLRVRLCRKQWPAILTDAQVVTTMINLKIILLSLFSLPHFYSDKVNISLQTIFSVSPSFPIKKRTQTVRKSASTELQCKAEGDLPIELVWTMKNSNLVENPRYTISEKNISDGVVLSNLSINHSQRNDSATFTCVATNAFGSDNTSIDLIVQEVPENPSDLEVLATASRNITLTWKAPYDGNSPITRFMIESKSKKGSWQHDISDRVEVEGEHRTATVSNLHPDTVFQFRVVAANDIGESGPSETLTAPTKEDFPGPPAAAEALAMSEDSIRVSWQQPEESNGKILEYTVYVKELDPPRDTSVKTFKVPARRTSYDATGLNRTSRYEFWVTAHTSIGEGSPSSKATLSPRSWIPAIRGKSTLL